MKRILAISVALNLALIGSLVFLPARPRSTGNGVWPAVAAAVDQSVPKATAAAREPIASTAEAAPFRWSRLLASNDYYAFVRNLRRAGCPEATIRDIVAGDTHRAFALERQQLNLDENGPGPWSQQTELEMVASLLGEQLPGSKTLPAQNGANPVAGSSSAAAVASSTGGSASGTAYPLFLQNVDWSALGFTAEQQAAIARVRQQYLSQIQNQSATGSADPAAPASSDSDSSVGRHDALPLPDQMLRDELGAQGYMAYEQQQYLAWFQPQVMANVGGGTLAIGNFTPP